MLLSSHCFWTLSFHIFDSDPAKGLQAFAKLTTNVTVAIWPHACKACLNQLGCLIMMLQRTLFDEKAIES